MPNIGKISEFVEGKESFQNYAERLEQFFAANSIDDEKQVAVFLSVIGSNAYGVVRNLCQPDLPKDKTYAQLIKLLGDHYNPRPLTISERFKFNKRNQREGEGVSDYIVELKKLSINCDFGNFLDDALRDRFVCGLLSETTQRKLLAEDKLTFDGAVKIASAMEMAEKDTLSFGLGGQTSVNKIQAKGRGQRPLNSEKKDTKSTPSYQYQRSCYRCGEKHAPERCRHKNTKCYNCSKIGHLARKCKHEQASNYVQDENDSEKEEDILWVFSNSDGKSEGYSIPLIINNQEVHMELDTGSGVTLINEETYRSKFDYCKLIPTKTVLKGYSGERIHTLGEFKVNVQASRKERKIKLRVIVVKGEKPNLLGRDWLNMVKLNWESVFDVNHVTSNRAKTAKSLEEEYKDLFVKDGQPIKGFKANIRLKEKAVPIFRKARPVPYALKSQVTEELKRLEKDAVIERIESSQWATPLVVVPKPNKKLRLCGDYKVTVNQQISEDQYPLPNHEDMFATLAGGKKFTKLDLSSAYTQLELEENSKEYLTLNTHLGLFRVHRLAFGVSSAPAIFQSIMDTVLTGLQGVVCKIDDILITAENDEKHLAILDEVFSRLRKHHIKLNKDKCEIMVKRVVYMGHMVDSEGIHTTEEKTKAVLKAPVPTNVSQLKSYLGLINYYGAFMPKLSTVLYSLHKLLRKDEPWNWSESCQKAFEKSKELLISNNVLVHYDQEKELRLACDASSYGLGAVISHVMEDGTERPIAFASRTLASAERNYAQVEKEALGIVFGVQKFHKYLYGRKFTLLTDHKALTTIFGKKKGIPTLAAARLQRWAIILSAYQYDIQYKPSADHANCDGLSRLPVESVNESEIIESVSFIEELPITNKMIEEATRRSTLLSKVLDFVQTGWPRYVDDKEMKPYFQRRLELSSDRGVLLWGMRVVVPEKLRATMLNEIHSEHVGMSRMKTLARSYVWWPGLDSDIESVARNCNTCQSLRNLPPETPLHPWKWSSRPMERVHVDFADFKSQSYLIMIDSFSKWLEMIPMKSTTSEKTIEKLRNIFASTGLPEEIVSDNGPQFRSGEFKEFMKVNGIRHTFTPPYHPASNGQVERAVQILKKALKGRLKDNQSSVNQRSINQLLANFLLKYRITPHTTTGVPPCELFVGRQLRTRLNLIKPLKEKSVQDKQEKMVEKHDSRVKMRKFQLGESVAVKTNVSVNKWIWQPGVIQKVLGELTYLVKCKNKIRYCHADHLIERHTNLQQIPEVSESDLPSSLNPSFTEGEKKESSAVVENEDYKINMPNENNINDTELEDLQCGLPSQAECEFRPVPEKINPLPVERRYPRRNRKAPDRLDL